MAIPAFIVLLIMFMFIHRAGFLQEEDFDFEGDVETQLEPYDYELEAEKELLRQEREVTTTEPTVPPIAEKPPTVEVLIKAGTPNIHQFEYDKEWMHQQEKRLRKITNRITNANDLPQLRIRLTPGLKPPNRRIVHIASNGDLLIASAALLYLYDDDDELAIIVGHELAHISLNHIAKKLKSQTERQKDAAAEDTIDEFLMLGQITYMTFDENEELKADLTGISYAKKAGLDIGRFEEVWIKLTLLELEGLDPRDHFGHYHSDYKERLTLIQQIVGDRKE